MSEDIMELVFLILLQATEDAEADLRAIMDELRRRNERLCRWRKLIARLDMHRDAADKDLVRSAGAAIADQLDSFSEIGEQMQLRLQNAMDRRSKFLEAVSNLMKKQSDTASAIVSNLK